MESTPTSNPPPIGCRGAIPSVWKQPKSCRVGLQCLADLLLALSVHAIHIRKLNVVQQDGF
eukprot:5572646-Pleurochrysis_carterae.AAC.1